MNANLIKYYDTEKKRTVPIRLQILAELKPRIVQMLMEDNITKQKMAPEWFKHNSYDESLKNIVYPKGIIDSRPYDTVARYRAAVNKFNSDFCQKSLNTSENNTEILIIALGDFVQQFAEN